MTQDLLVWTKPPVEMKVYMALGEHVECYGKLASLYFDGARTPAILLDREVMVRGTILESGALFLVDPRAVILEVESQHVLSNPRNNETNYDWVSDWLEKNPWWPGVLEIDGLVTA